MVPPPDSTGDQFPDFDKMTPQEQLAWLESLARRQGAKEEEFITAADLEIAEVPPDAVIDEPGYVPFSIGGSPQEGEPRKRKSEPRAAAEKPEPALEAEPVGLPLESAADPMQWLDSLAADSGEDLDISPAAVPETAGDLLEEARESDFDLTPVESPEAELEEEFLLDLSPDMEPTQPAEAMFDLEPESVDEGEWVPHSESFEMPQVHAAAEGSVSSDEDFLGGIDPMLWLESLAARQGAKAEELLTSADLHIDEVSDDVEIDEPGYVPFSMLGETPRQPERQEEPEAAPQEEPQLLGEVSPPVELEAEQPEPMSAEVDTVSWLDSLTKHEEITGEELAGEEMPVDVAPLVAEVESAVSEGAPEEQETVDDSLSWLEALAAESAGDLETLFAEERADLSSVREALEVTQEGGEHDPLLGMTDEQIAEAQAKGTLTGEQELAWLQRQARKLVEARQAEGIEEELLPVEELEPARPAELPDWLEQMRQQSEEEVTAESAGISEAQALLTEAPDVTDWLGTGAEVEPGVSELALETDFDTLWAEATEIKGEAAPEEPAIESELEAFIGRDFVPEAPDQLAEALDSEFTRRTSGDESEPAWYTEALAKGALESTGVESELAEAKAGGEDAAGAVLEEATLGDTPDWLKDIAEEAPAAPTDIPSWLTEPIEAAPAAEAEAVPDWLAGVAEETVDYSETAVPGWLQSLEPEPSEEKGTPPVSAVEKTEPVPKPAPEPKPAAVAPAPKEKPVELPPVPAGDLFDTYRQHLQADPSDYAVRLALARALHTSQQQWAASLDQYEVLIGAMQLMPDVTHDLLEMSEALPDNPRIRRLIGDVFMRRGMLKEALDAYRSALDQL